MASLLPTSLCSHNANSKLCSFLHQYFTLVGIFAISWFAWILLIKLNKAKSRSPPPPPGPRGLPLVGNLPFLEPDLHAYFARLARTYGPVVKLKLGSKVTILVTSPSAARQVLKEQDITFANHDAPAVAMIATGGRDIAWNPYGPEWRMLRKVCVLKLLSNATLDKAYSLRRKEVRKTVAYIYGQSGSAVAIGEHIFLTIMNAVTNMLWGGTADGDAGAAAELRELISEFTDLLGLPNVSDFFPVLAPLDLQGLGKRMAKIATKLNGVLDELIDQRRSRLQAAGAGEKSMDFIQFLLEFNNDNEDSKTPITIDHIKALLLDMVIGGSDTSSNSIEFTLGELINKPELMKRAQQELDQVVGKHNIVEESHIRKLPYLLAIVKESLRLHPVLPLLIPHSPSAPTTVAGYKVPKGSRVFVNAWAIHRDPSIWDNPLQFDPDRFFLLPASNTDHDHHHHQSWDFGGSTEQFSYFPFGSGRRMCAGIAMAERMVLYTLATLLHSFDWKAAAEGEKVDVSEKFGIVLKLNTPLVAIPTPRLSNPALYHH